MQVPDTIVIDFETYPIMQRPEYPPEPIGCAVSWPGQQPEYFTGSAMLRELERAWGSGLPLLAHNQKFDHSVAWERLGLPLLSWERLHDSMFLIFLDQPYAKSLALKPAAHAILGMEPEERNAVDDWIWEHRQQLEQQYPQYGKVSKSKLGKWIFAAPHELVGPYAIGDIVRTRKLFEHLWLSVHARGMGEAYDRERKLLPILMRNERVGIRCDVEGLRRDVDGYQAALETAEQALCNRLGVSIGLNFDADEEVADALERAGIVTEFATTGKSGKRSVSKETLTPDKFSDPQVASALGYRNRLVTCLKMFMQPWLAQAEKRDGYLSTNWNQVRGTNGGTRTGRPSTNDPNFLNISKNFEGRSDGYQHPSFLGVPHLPLVRQYLLPDVGHTWLNRDQSSQEVRCFAHFECGALHRAYCDDPLLDPHQWIKREIVNATGVELEHTRVKNVTFARLYGGSTPAVMRQARCKDLAEAKQIIAYHDKALPGRRLVDETIKYLVRCGRPIRTWGGRLYDVRPPEIENGKLRTFDYQLLNYLCQGSAADLTKQNIIDFDALGTSARWLVQVYDELSISAPAAEADELMQTLRETMEIPYLSVPLRTKGKRGVSWGALEKCE
jgi:DNA polymerase I-like protein with 3'-5' exonuclease and polymerase domains